MLLPVLDLILRQHALAHPALQIGLAGAPEVQIRVQLAAQPFDVQQGLLQQHQLRLDFHVEAAGGLEQAQQQLAEGDVFQRALEDRLADAANRRFKFVHAGVSRYPARVDMQLGNAAVVALEEGHQVARQVALVLGRKAADDAKVDGDVLRLPGVLARDEDVARVHVGVEEAVAEYLGKEDFHAAFGKLLHIGTLVGQRRQVGHRDALDALHHQYLVTAPVPVDLGNVDQLRIFKVAAQLGGVGGFAVQVKLVENGAFVVLDHLDWAQAATFGGQLFQQACGDEQPLDVLVDGLADAWAHHLDHHLAAVFQACSVYLGDRGGG